MDRGYDREKLARLGSFLAILNADGSGSWSSMERTKDGSFVLPFFELSEAAMRLLEACYADGWILEDFDWVEWKGSAEAVALEEDPAALDAASPDQLSKLLTAVARQDRFVDGALAAAFSSGLIPRILCRAAQLAEA